MKPNPFMVYTTLWPHSLSVCHRTWHGTVVGGNTHLTILLLTCTSHSLPPSSLALPPTTPSTINRAPAPILRLPLLPPLILHLRLPPPPTLILPPLLPPTPQAPLPARTMGSISDSQPSLETLPVLLQLLPSVDCMYRVESVMSCVIVLILCM